MRMRISCFPKSRVNKLEIVSPILRRKSPNQVVTPFIMPPSVRPPLSKTDPRRSEEKDIYPYQPIETTSGLRCIVMFALLTFRYCSFCLGSCCFGFFPSGMHSPALLTSQVKYICWMAVYCAVIQLANSKQDSRTSTLT